MSAVVVDTLVKTYGNKKETISALRGVSMKVEEGEIFGIIGPDGAGKSTLFRILTTLLMANSGTAMVEGFDVVKDFKKIRNTVGYMPGKFSLYQDLTVEENLRFFATIFNTTVDKNIDLIKNIYQQIEPFKTRPAGKLSGGMKQKLALCCALIHKPTVLFLDEPTTGVDPVSRKEFWEMVGGLKTQGITILVSTPYMDEAKLCDRIALMQHGNILEIETPKIITHRYPRKLFALKSHAMYPLLLELRAYPETYSCYAFGDYHHLSLKNQSLGPRDITAYLDSKMHMDSLSILPIEPTIEDCFMALLQE